MNWLGLDIGGANIKVADSKHYGCSFSFPLWQKPHELPAVLGQLIASAPRVAAIAVTMTGELADCFETKREGVLHILDAVEQAANPRPLAVYLVDGRLVSLSASRSQPLLAAASNWHALARLASRSVYEFPALLIDIGSTTTDVIPLGREGAVTPARTDTERLLRGELVYVGMSRTPVAAVVSQLPYRGNLCPLAAELFATTADVAILLNLIPEQPGECSAADGRPLTKASSRDRMARMLCADRETFSEEDARQAAQYVWKGQICRIEEAINRVIEAMPTRPQTILLSGTGEELGRNAISTLRSGVRIESLAHLLGPHLSSVAPAHAVAVLATEMEIVL